MIGVLLIVGATEMLGLSEGTELGSELVLGTMLGAMLMEGESLGMDEILGTDDGVVAGRARGRRKKNMNQENGVRYDT